MFLKERLWVGLHYLMYCYSQRQDSYPRMVRRNQEHLKGHRSRIVLILPYLLRVLNVLPCRVLSIFIIQRYLWTMKFKQTMIMRKRDQWEVKCVWLPSLTHPECIHNSGDNELEAVLSRGHWSNGQKFEQLLLSWTGMRKRMQSKAEQRCWRKSSSSSWLLSCKGVLVIICGGW